MGERTNFEARDGDQLVVTYPDVAIQIAPFNNVRIGGLTYTRCLKAGDDVNLEYERIYKFLYNKAVIDGREKLMLFQQELERISKGGH